MTRFLLVLILLKSANSFAQPDPLVFGEFRPSELKSMTDSTNAGAVVLCDYDQVRFESVYGDLKLIYEKHVRIKILSKEGFKWANVIIPYDSYRNNEEITEVEANSVSLDAGGKEEKHRLRGNNIIDETIYGSHRAIKFSIPFVKEQCVIEYKYKITSKIFYDLKERYFRWEIPVKWSELRTKIPPIFEYVYLFQNPIPLQINETKNYTQLLVLSKHDQPLEQYNQGMQGTVSVTGTYSRYVAKDISAFIEEPFTTSIKDYQPKFVFHINGATLRKEYARDLMDTWEKVSYELSQDENFGNLDLGNEIRKITDGLIDGLTDSLDKMIAIYHYVQNSMQWNGLYAKYLEKDFKKPFEHKSGTSAEINLMLLAMLRREGFHAYPVILSTRGNGKLQKDYPMLRQFNHVINYVKIDSVQYLLDATDPNVPYYQLPQYDINDSALVINKSEPFWISLSDINISRKITNCFVVVESDGKITSETEISVSRHYAVECRNELDSMGKERYLKENYLSKIPGVNILSSSILNLDSTEAPVNINLKFETKQCAVIDNDFIYVKPKLSFALAENPFKTKTRTYAVDFNFLQEETFILNITCPDGYEFSKVPNSVKLSLPKNSLQYTSAATASGNRVNMIIKLSVNKVEFSRSEYADLREFYNQIIAKEAEQLVIARKK